jgi:hypothetical protein
MSKEEYMRTRRELVSGMFILLLAVAGLARAAATGPLEVIYYYLPG